MRSLVVASILALGLSGCLSSGTQPLASQDCSSSSDQVAAVQRGVLLPAEPAETPYEEEGNRIRVHARAGQDLTALATWSVAMGEAEVRFDGPSTHQASTDRTWTMTTHDVPEGDYVLEIVGAPVAVEVVFTMQLVASGCTPA